MSNLRKIFIIMLIISLVFIFSLTSYTLWSNKDIKPNIDLNCSSDTISGNFVNISKCMEENNITNSTKGEIIRFTFVNEEMMRR